jgi:hypothetical protein
MESFSIGILSWHSTDVLINTLTSYHDNGLLTLSNDVTIFFQETNDTDRSIAAHYGLKTIESRDNIGIGKAFLKLAEKASNRHILLLEHDWVLIEDMKTTSDRIQSGITLIDGGYECVRYRHKERPGFPHFSERNYSSVDKALAYHDPEIKANFPHLLDSVHFFPDPSREFPTYIGKHYVDEQEFWVSTSKYANFSNNPCLYNRDFFIKTVKPFVGEGIDLEGKISHWWNRQNFNVAHGRGLFTHKDPSKYPNT